MWKWWMFTACRSVSVLSDPKPTPSLQLHSSKCMHAKDIYIFIQKWSSLEMRYEKLFWIWQELEINNFLKEEECSPSKIIFHGKRWNLSYVLLNWIQNPPLPFCPHPYHQLLLPTESKHRTWPAWPSSLRIPSLFSGDWLLDFLTIDHYSPDKVLYPRPILFSSHIQYIQSYEILSLWLYINVKCYHLLVFGILLWKDLMIYSTMICVNMLVSRCRF